WNIACGFAQNKNQLIAFPLLSGLGGSAPLSVGGGFLTDVSNWHAEQRGKAITIYSLAPLLGPVLCPVCGSWFVSRSVSTLWVFRSTSIADAAVQLSGLFFFRKTYASWLLDKKAQEIRMEQNNGHGPQRRILTVYESSSKHSWQNIFRTALIRPLQLFGVETIIQLLGLCMSFVYGILYLFLTTTPSIFTNVYHKKVGVGGLHYIALGVGLSLASQINAQFMDRVYIHLKNRNGGVGGPKFRLRES
ncbi:hypothetical protein HYPSUDRAFT_148148, partial [Hypholoma sublateritium FD-334 SS-4]